MIPDGQEQYMEELVTHLAMTIPAPQRGDVSNGAINVPIWGWCENGIGFAGQLRRAQLLPFYRGLAQLVARLVWDQDAVGSSPASPTTAVALGIKHAVQETGTHINGATSGSIPLPQLGAEMPLVLEIHRAGTGTTPTDSLVKPGEMWITPAYVVVDSHIVRGLLFAQTQAANLTLFFVLYKTVFIFSFLFCYAGRLAVPGQTVTAAKRETLVRIQSAKCSSSAGRAPHPCGRWFESNSLNLSMFHCGMQEQMGIGW